MKSRNKVYAKRSLSSKYMNVSVLIVFFSFFVLGTILTIAISSYWSKEKLDTLDTRAESIAEFIKSKTSVNDSGSGESGTVIINGSSYLQEVLRLLANDVGNDIIITNRTGLSILTVSDTIHNNMFIQSDIIRTAASGQNYSSRGTLNNLYHSERYIVARPIYYNNDRGILGVVIVTSDGSDITDFTDMVLKIFILSAIAALAVSFLAIGLFSYNLAKPLRQMAQAAKQFGKGEFDIRVSETSNDEIGELAVAFNNMADSLASSESTRRSFVANVSHELKTPMTTISGFIDGILDGTVPPEKNHYYLQIVSDEIKRLSRLVRSMLDLSRIDNGELKINYQSFDLVATLLTIIITFEQEIDKKNIDVLGLDRLTPKMIYGDKDLLHQVIYNLIENAVKFTPEGGTIEFDITENGERTDFIIKNSGNGIKKSELPMVFDKFYKTDKSRSKDKKGLGLGLYLVRSIIRLHGGEIIADSEYGEYTEFLFYIPKRSKRQDKK